MFEPDYAKVFWFCKDKYEILRKTLILVRQRRSEPANVECGMPESRKRLASRD
jgi:hypothetical protein